jgi:hypothetical protein
LPEEKYRTLDPHPSTQNLYKTLTFDEIAENSRQFANLTDNTRQIMYFTGFQKGGFDNAYPYPFDTEPRCGSLEDLRRCILNLREHNVYAGLHDNFDDVASMHVNDFPYVAEDEEGGPWRGWLWPAGQTYIMGYKRYVESGLMAERVKTMLGLLPLKDTYHLDVLTAETLRYDFNPENPASAEDSYRAKMAVVDEWNRYGIDITSEMLSHPSVGKIGFALHTRLDTREVFIPGDSYVPLVPMVYHGFIGYGAPSRSVSEMLWGLLIGGHTFYEEDITGELCVSRFYIQNIPAMKLYGKEMTGFVKENNFARADYGEGSYVEADFNEGTYKAVVNGVLIGRDFSTFVPANRLGAWLAYSLSGNPVKYPRPKGFGDMKAFVLTTKGIGAEIKCLQGLDQETVTLALPPKTPVIFLS